MTPEQRERAEADVDRLCEEYFGSRFEVGIRDRIIDAIAAVLDTGLEARVRELTTELLHVCSECWAGKHDTVSPRTWGDALKDWATRLESLLTHETDEQRARRMLGEWLAEHPLWYFDPAAELEDGTMFELVSMDSDEFFQGEDCLSALEAARKAGG